MSSLESAGSPLDKPKPGDEINDFDRKVYLAMNKAYAQMQLLDQHNEFMVQHLTLNQPPISISQVFGFAQFTGKSDTISAGSTTTSVNTPTDLADTAGPTLTGLADGRYLIFFGCGAANNSAGQNTFMGVKVNSTEPGDTETAFTNAAATTPLMRAIDRTLDTGGNNTLLARYYVGGASTGTYFYRWLIALRYANI